MMMMKKKQEVSSEVLPSSQASGEGRKDGIKRKQKIRKERVQSTVIDFSDLRSIDTKKLNREEKARVQKAKNRVAAQKSRDVHRQYVKEMEDQLNQLRAEQTSRICPRCKRQLQQCRVNDSGSSQQQGEEKSRVAFSNLTHQNQQLSNGIDFPLLDKKEWMFEQSLFLRHEDDHSESYPFLKLGLFVMAVVLAAICVGVTCNVRGESRALMELPNGEEQEPIVIKKVDLTGKKVKVEDKNRTAMVKVRTDEHGLIALNSDDCLRSLMRIDRPSPSDNKKSLRSYRESTVSDQNYLVPQDGIFLCQVRGPQKRDPQQNFSSSIRSNLIRLYVLGSQIKNIVTSSNIQTNGVYQVLARIKEVNIVSNHNCLL